MTLDARMESARGYMLMGIFYVHLLITFAQSRADPADAVSAFIQIKLLAPHVSVFFFLSGSGARHIGKRSFQTIAAQSLALFGVSALLQIVGYWIGPFWHQPWAGWADALRQVIKPVLLGTGHVTFVAWFFVVLAIVRPLAWAVARGWLPGVAMVAAFAGSVALGSLFLETRNLFEWRNVPIALLFFWIGSRIPRRLPIPNWAGLLALALTLAVTWFNRPGVLWQGPCLSCDVLFVSQQTIGQFDTVPVYIVQELLFLVFLLWAAQFTIALGMDKLSRFFGRWSMQALILHGLLMAGLLTFVVRLFPTHPSPLLFAVMLVGSIALHAALLVLLRPLIDRGLALCFAIGRMVSQLPGLRARGYAKR